MSKRLIASKTAGNVEVKVYRDSEWEEWQCVPLVNGARVGKGDSATYYTNDKEDALSTAQTMANELAQVKA